MTRKCQYLADHFIQNVYSISSAEKYCELQVDECDNMISKNKHYCISNLSYLALRYETIFLISELDFPHYFDPHILYKRKAIYLCRVVNLIVTLQTIK